ncbi:MAG: metallophosphoesterase [Spirochaetes bacterium]|uniref:Metallophosphoesterase n=1 Tax=Candidatus Ornithospirochaeta stercoripullorum TaxID=2840899 RepID=A0A9D9E0Y2_9SPIO|nr:metallophosphoesterase [Candidatus Ornithospirochaeta stercoripullorum]
MGRNLIVGDIHSQYGLLMDVLSAASFNPEEDVLYSVGDITDRGPEIVRLIQFLSSLHDYRPVLGNHDLWLRDYLVSGLCPSIWIDCNGGQRTVKDFMRSFVSDKEKVLMGEWLSQAPYVRIEDKYIIMHGGIPNLWTIRELEKIASLPPSTIGYAGIEDPSVSPVWNRSYLQSAMAFENGADPAVLQAPLETDRKIFVGHTPLNSPFHSERYHLIAIDTGAGHNKRLTLMDMDTLKYWQAGKND